MDRRLASFPAAKGVSPSPLALLEAFLAAHSGRIRVPRVVPHRSGLQPGKGCLKTPGKDSTSPSLLWPAAW
jgi:hypothetical protein